MEAQFIETARECLANGDKLLDDAKTLKEWSSSPASLALAILAEEEFAKGFLLFLVGQGVLYWNSAILQATRDHCCKHLLSELMEFADPDFDAVIASFERSEARHAATMRLFDEMNALHRDAARDFAETMAVIESRNELWRKVARLKEEEKRERAFPPRIVDAINILRHVKIGRWERGYPYDDEEYDLTAQSIADGARDREKQRALYVRVSKTGAVSSRPDEIADESIRHAIKRSNKLSLALSGLLEYGPVGAEFERLIRHLKAMFPSQEELHSLFPETAGQRVLFEYHLRYDTDPR